MGEGRMSKGHKQRRRQVSKARFECNWHNTFTGPRGPLQVPTEDLADLVMPETAELSWADVTIVRQDSDPEQ